MDDVTAIVPHLRLLENVDKSMRNSAGYWSNMNHDNHEIISRLKNRIF
jgi:hypothetical protein